MKITLLFLSIFLFLPVQSQNVQSIFADTTLINLELKADFDSLFADVDDERTKYCGQLKIYNNPLLLNIPVELKTRGNFRRKSQNCNFPPLRLYFDKKNTKNTCFDGVKNLKLVTHCQKEKQLFKDKVVLEYLIYQTFGILTEYSFKTRLAKTTYINTRNNDTTTSYSFLIERDKDMADRLDKKLLSVAETYTDSVNSYQGSIVSIFEYMIANNDWSFEMAHNIYYLQSDEMKGYIPVPYDFDWSGLMNMPYRINPVTMEPDQNIKPIYKGIKGNKVNKHQAIMLFNSKKKAIISLFRNCPYISKPEREHCIRYIKRFYRVLNNPFRNRSIFKS